MKNFKGTVILAIVVAAIGAFAVLEFRKEKAEKETAATKDDVFRDVSVESVAEVAVKPDGRDGFTLKKNEGQWQIQWANREDRGDKDGVESYVRGLLSANVTEVELSSAPDWTKYGLDQPKSTAQIRLTPGTKLKLAVGGNTYDDGFYVRRNDEDKLLVGDSSWRSHFDKDVHSLRARDFNIGAKEVRRIELKSGSQKLDLEKSEKGWSERGQPDVRLDIVDVTEFVNELTRFRADDVLPDEATAAALSKHGVSKPATTLTFHFDKADPLTVRVSKEKDGSVYYASSESKSVFKISADRAKIFAKALDDLRDRQFLFRFDVGRVHSFEVQREGDKEPFLFVKKDGAWVQEPAPEGKKLNEEKVQDIVTRLPNLEVGDFSVAGKAAPTKNKVTVFSAPGEKLFELAYGNSFNKNGMDYYLVKTNLYDRVVAVSADRLDFIVKAELYAESEQKGGGNAPHAKSGNQ